MITITFPDGRTQEYEKGVSALEIATGISKGLARECIVARVNEQLVDLTAAITEDASLELIKFSDARGKEVFWHTTAHVLAQAVTRLYPDAKPTIGPPIEEGGFYYDFANLSLKESDFEALEEEMKKVVEEDYAPTRVEHESFAEVKELYGDNPFKIQIAEEYADAGLSSYKQGDFIDLCRGPHLPRLGMIKAFKLTKLAGAYWRGDASNEQLTRIYGISFPDKKQLRKHLTFLEEAKKRDHRKIGKRLDLFGFESVSPGSPIFYPKGTVVYNAFLEFLRKEYRKRGYDEVITPVMYAKELWEQSGHWEHYRDDMFFVRDGDQEYSLKPMNCPSHCLVYNRKQYSYRDLPVRIADFAPLHRNELSGTLGGLTRVRKFSQDDAHIFCTPEQIKQEIADLIDFASYLYEDVVKMSFDHVELSTRPEKFLGEEEDWDQAETALQEALEEHGLDYIINEGDGAFYGPKIDFHIRDAIGRTWQTATIQLDFQLPARFECEYLGADNASHTVVMIHRALLGSLERFLGVFIEDCEGKLPLWCSPEQVRILPITDSHSEYARTVASQLQEAGVRVEVDQRNESLSKKVREAQLAYTPYILVLGDKEVSSQTVNVRTRDNEVHGTKPVSSFVEQVVQEVEDKE